MMSNAIYGNPVGAGATPCVRMITEHHHIAELDVGVYYIRINELLGDGRLGSVVILNDEHGIKQELNNGLLMIYHREDADTEDATYCSLCVHYIGECTNIDNINVNNDEYTGNTLSSSSEFFGTIKCVRFKEDTDVYMVATWYGYEQVQGFTNITTKALRFDLNADADNCHIPTAKAVYDYIENVQTNLMEGQLPEVTESDNGKILRVDSGVWTAQNIYNAEGVGF